MHKRILIVDDEPALLDMMREMYERGGLEDTYFDTRRRANFVLSASAIG